MFDSAKVIIISEKQMVFLKNICFGLNLIEKQAFCSSVKFFVGM